MGAAHFQIDQVLPRHVAFGVTKEEEFHCRPGKEQSRLKSWQQNGHSFSNLKYRTNRRSEEKNSNENRLHTAYWLEIMIIFLTLIISQFWRLLITIES